MQAAPIPVDEKERLYSLHTMNILDTEPEERFDKITEEAVFRFKTPICTISLIDADREWFKSCLGVDIKQGPRSSSFCGHAMLSKYIYIVEDTLLDPKFKDNPQVVNPPHIRFYAGMAIRNRKTGQPIGVFCVKDIKPRLMEPADITALIDFANQAEEMLNTPKK